MGKSTQKSQNTEACRDLSGRRMRDVSTEKKYVTNYTQILLGIYFSKTLSPVEV